MLRAGDNIFKDLNEDGVLDENDIKYLGSNTAPYSFSLNAGVTYKNFDLSAVFQGSIGRVVYNTINAYSVPTNTCYTNSTTASIGNTWSVDNPDAYYSPYTTDSNINKYNYQQSSLTAQNASYIRLKNLTLGYAFPEKILNQLSMRALRVYVTGVDLWEVSGMESGWDPEAERAPSGTQRYPFMRSITAGLNITF